MTGKTHRILGIAAGVGYYLAMVKPEYNPATFGMVVASSYIGALLPDIDQPAAEIWHTLPFGKSVGKVVHEFLDHRNFSHSLLGFAAFGFLIFLLLGQFPSYWGIDTNMVFLIFIIAYGSHLLADMFTVEGIPLFFPFGRFMGLPPEPFEGARIVTGKWFENLVLFPLFNIILILLIVFYWGKILSILFK